VQRDQRRGTVALDVVDDRRQAEIAALGEARRAVARDAALALERFDWAEASPQT
jgi:hypothetical protein